MKVHLLVIEAANFFNQYSAFLSCSMSHTFFDDVARKLVLGKSEYFTSNAAD